MEPEIICPATAVTKEALVASDAVKVLFVATDAMNAGLVVSAATKLVLPAKAVAYAALVAAVCCVREAIVLERLDIR